MDLDKKIVTTSPGFKPHAHAIPFDHLVLALGTVTDFRGLPGLPEHAMPFKNLGDALALRNHVIRALEEASIERHDMELRTQLLTFVVAGGGFSGVEVVAELNDFVRAVAPAAIRASIPRRSASCSSTPRSGSSGDGPDARRCSPRRSSESVASSFASRPALPAPRANAAILAGGEAHRRRKRWSRRSRAFPHPLIEIAAPARRRGTAGCVDEQPAAASRARPTCGRSGDCARIANPDGMLVPPTAQHATRQARRVRPQHPRGLCAVRARRASSTSGGSARWAHSGTTRPSPRSSGVKLSGFLAWWVWRTIYLMKMPGWGRRLKVASSWTLDLILPPELVRAAARRLAAASARSTSSRGRTSSARASSATASTSS